MEKKSIPQISADASLLVSEISRLQPGEKVTWQRINELVGWSVQEKPGIMVTVRNRLLRDYGLVLGNVRGEGYAVLNDSEIVEGELARDRSMRRRSAQRSKRKAGTVELSKLNELQKLKCLGEITAAHIVIESSKDKSVKQIESQMNGSNAPLALNKALDAVKKNLAGAS